VLDRVRVAGYDAQVLKAPDTKALQDWLAEHGYDARPALMKWLEPYVKAGWIITAFQIAKEKKEVQQVAPQAVRMSFTTDRPFFPYSEPKDPHEGGGKGTKRLLRIFFLADQRMQGALDEQLATWPGTTAWAGRLDDEKRQALAQTLSPRVNPPDGGWLTVFDDQTSARPGRTDLFFTPSDEQSEVRRPPIIRYEVVERTAYGEAIIGVLICAGVLASPLLLLWYLRRRARRARSA